MSLPKTVLRRGFFTLFLVAAALAALVNYRTFEQKRDTHYARLQDELNTAYSVITLANQETAHINYNIYINQSEILELYKQANSADEAVRAAVRRQLLEKLGPIYKLMKVRDVRQLHFHLPNSESFLRFHQPEQYGDSLKGVRYSVDKANAELVEVNCFEEGRIENGFRNVFPLIHNGEHLGSVEISTDFDTIRRRLERQFHNRYAFMVQRRLVEDTVLADELKNYRLSDLSDDYLYEPTYTPDNTQSAINAGLKPKIQEKLKAGEGFEVEAGGHGAAWLMVFFPVKNGQGQKAAYIVSYVADATIRGYYSEFVVTLAISIAGLLIIIVLLYFLMHALRLTRHSEERFKDIARSTSDWVWETDAQGHYTYVSGEIKELLGFEVEEVVGKTPFDLMDEEEAGRVGKIFGEIAGANKAIVDLENWNVSKEGKKLCFLTNGLPLLNANGELLGYRGTDKDITDRKQAEPALRGKEIFLQTIFDSIQEPMHVIDRDYKVLLTNKKLLEMKNVKQEEVRGKYCYEAYQGRNELCEQCASKEVFETGKPYSLIKTVYPQLCWGTLHV